MNCKKYIFSYNTLQTLIFLFLFCVEDLREGKPHYYIVIKLFTCLHPRMFTLLTLHFLDIRYLQHEQKCKLWERVYKIHVVLQLSSRPIRPTRVILSRAWNFQLCKKRKTIWVDETVNIVEGIIQLYICICTL